jgi:hypothetical protein
VLIVQGPRPKWTSRGLMASWEFRRLLPDSATLQGTVLSTEKGSCDLATAAVVTVGSSLTTQGSVYFRYLEVRQNRTQSPPIRLLLVAFNWFPVAPEHLRLLAEIIGARSVAPGKPDRRFQEVATYLRDIADRAERQAQPTDWSFRAGPMADRRTEPGKYDHG